jgi:tetratricopeptide (TPR) repeat protein
MKLLKYLLLCSGLFFPLSIFANDSTPLLDHANQFYLQGKYEQAIASYQEIVSQGYESAEVYFNLGNCYYQTNAVGLSILYYERAKKLNPQDEDILFNLQLANQRTLDKIEPAPKLFLEEWWNTIQVLHSEKEWSVRSILFFVLSFVFMAIFISTAHRSSKLFSFWLTIVFLFLTAITFAIAGSRYSNSKNHTTAVMIATSAEVKNSPADNGVKLFVLHEGTLVTTPETNGEWVKIELSPEKVGWVKKTSLAFI